MFVNRVKLHQTPAARSPHTSPQRFPIKGSAPNEARPNARIGPISARRIRPSGALPRSGCRIGRASALRPRKADQAVEMDGDDEPGADRTDEGECVRGLGPDTRLTRQRMAARRRETERIRGERKRMSMTMATALAFSMARSQADLVGATGFEPATCGTQNRRATRLRHAPTPARLTQRRRRRKPERGQPQGHAAVAWSREGLRISAPISMPSCFDRPPLISST